MRQYMKTKPTHGATVAIPEKFKKAGTKGAKIVFVLDDSGSMQSCRKQTIEGFNEFVEGQKANEMETKVTLYKFDGRSVNCVFEDVLVENVEPLSTKTYNPMGSTNLNDAIGQVIININDELSRSKKADRPLVNVVILTDGYENSSRMYTNAMVKSCVEKTEAKDWSFMFLGANIDAFAVGSQYGFGVSNTMQYAGATIDIAIQSASRMSVDLTKAKGAGISSKDAYSSAGFTDEERKKSNN